jgi:hypothetical protein
VVDPVSCPFLELREAMRSLMGLGKRKRLGVDQPTITGRIHPASDAYNLLFACDCAFVDQLIATQTRAPSAFFLWWLVCVRPHAFPTWLLG